MLSRHLSVFAVAIVALAAPARAGDVAVQAVDAAGRPIADAVVTVHPAAGVPRGPIRFPWAAQVVQQNIQFVPGTLIVPVGSTVPFPNRDKVRHHVYSFSKPARFDLKLFGRDQTRAYTFRTPGAVAIGCNIHDSMRGFIKVVDTPWAGKTAANGLVRLAGIPAGQATITVWHPRLRARNNELVMKLPLPAGGLSRRVQLSLR